MCKLFSVYLFCSLAPILPLFLLYCLCFSGRRVAEQSLSIEISCKAPECAISFRTLYNLFITFADALNDLSMLKDAGIGDAMANACDDAKELAGWIALSYDEAGVACGINKFCFGEM
ncbi:HAD family hydrolase [uncultured Oscillibacter sp.]|uniref:HAD family hydrolase n=1 Tax=uncultured Oscillibacter sp. TaxID=876091 RepID=UPI002630A433|nr:HAD hydrolase family protein [uncultured Oscillibacter sp.]